MTTIVQDYLEMAKTLGHTFHINGIESIYEMNFPGLEELNPFAEMIETSWRANVIDDQNIGCNYLCFGMYYMYRVSSRSHEYRQFEDAMKLALCDHSFFPSQFADVNGEYMRTITECLCDFYEYKHIEGADEHDEWEMDQMRADFIWGLVRAIWIQKIVESTE